MDLQLTYIPAQYWTNPLSKFTLIDDRESPPHDSPFFLLWHLDNLEIAQLELEIGKIFPSIPVKKLLTGKINLVSNPDGNLIEQSRKQLPISPIVGKIIPVPPAIKLLFQLNIIESRDRSQRMISYSDSIKTWSHLTKFMMELLSRGNFVPILEQMDESNYEGKWKVILKTQSDHLRLNSLLQKAVWAAYNIPINFMKISDNSEKFLTTGMWHPSFLFSEFMDTSADYLIRNSVNKEFLSNFSKRYDSEIDEFDNICYDDEQVSWDLRFLNSCIGKNRTFNITKFCDTPIPGILRNWVQKTQGFSFSLGVSFTFRLDYPKTENGEWILGFFLQPLHDPKIFIPLEDLWDGIMTHQEEYANVCDDESLLQEEVLRALGTASKYFPPIIRALDGKNPHQVKLEAAEVMDFMRISMYLLIQAGFKVVLPDEFTSKGQQRLTARMVISSQEKSIQRTRNSGISPAAPLFTMDSMLEYRWEARLEGKELTEKEFLQLADSREPLIFLRGQWILIDQSDMNALRPIFENEQKISGKIPYSEALKLGMAGEIQVDESGSAYEVNLVGEFHNIISTLSQIEELETISIPQNFQGKLRPYQEKALTWLGNMAKFNFGVCLADDMGLGKTIEVISFLLYEKEQFPHRSGSILVICPTSVIFNWAREIKKFAPELHVFTHHGPDRKKEAKYLKEFLIPHQVILTTYGTIRNDIDFFGTIPFAGIILDESQNIKNYRTQQTQAIFQLKSNYRIALSGTPIENRLIELWTLFEFLNPGLFGKRNEFQQKFILPVERFHDDVISSKLKRFISPFILRRLKSDKSIINDLPEKNEIKVYLELSPLQAQIYAQIVSKTMEEIENLEESDIKRRGLILRLLTHTKQICNHPYQFLHYKMALDDETEPLLLDSEEIPMIEESLESSLSIDNKKESLEEHSLEDLFDASIKMQRLGEMIEEILEEGNKMLIFTQFKQMGDILQYVLEKKYKFPVLFFHGGIPQKDRSKMVDSFQSSNLSSPPIMILSLRAGGTGLNLTQASTVFHFDRWWNPAVEDQATDRAYRIGQKNQVNVYKFIAINTIEEKIDQILEEKRNLADRILSSSGENWITNLSNEELRELFSMR